jgi:hypothetical protein
LVVCPSGEDMVLSHTVNTRAPGKLTQGFR